MRYILITPDIAHQQNLPQDHGALIISSLNSTDVSVIPGSPADKAGLAPNDIILKVNDAEINESHTLSELLNQFNPGETISLEVYHKNQTKKVQVKLAQSPDNG